MTPATRPAFERKRGDRNGRGAVACSSRQTFPSRVDAPRDARRHLTLHGAHA